jgi:hypothetical protein
MMWLPVIITAMTSSRYILDSAPANSSNSSSSSSSSSRPAAGSFPRLAGAAFLASVPPAGNRDLIFRWLKRDLVLSWKITWCVLAVCSA